MGFQGSKLIPCCLVSEYKTSIVEAPNTVDDFSGEAGGLPAFCEFTLEQLKNATSGFAVENIVSKHGEKALNVIYKGNLDNQKRIAIKCFYRSTWPDPRQFLVAERALFLWNNDHIRTLITQNLKVILPIIFPALESNTRSHWNQAVQSLTLNVKKIFSDADQALFDDCLSKFQEDQLKDKETLMKQVSTWKRLEDVAASKAWSNGVLLDSSSASVAISPITSSQTDAGS